MRGFTLIELMIITAIVVITSGTVAGVALSMHNTDRQTAAYVEDVEGLRRAVQALERDLRGATGGIDELGYSLEGDWLLRRDRVLARNIAAFAIKQDGPLVTATLELKPRSATPPTRRPAVSLRVCLRPGGAR